MRKEYWFPKLMDRTRYETWASNGSKRMGERVHERVVEILATHEVPPLPDEINAGIDNILAAADQKAEARQTDLV